MGPKAHIRRQVQAYLGPIASQAACSKVVIYSPARTASQQGSGKVGRWKINFVSTQNTCGMQHDAW
ncbi:hypothetical protein ABZP36_000795 [Zizania latifolia]